MKDEMTVEQRAQYARRFLQDAEREFANGDIDQASEKFWRAATSVTAVVAKQLGWSYKNNRDLKNAVEALASKSGDKRLAYQYSAIEMFYMRVRYGLAEDFQLDSCRPTAHKFVKNMLALSQDKQLIAKMRKHANDSD